MTDRLSGNQPHFEEIGGPTPRHVNIAHRRGKAVHVGVVRGNMLRDELLCGRTVPSSYYTAPGAAVTCAKCRARRPADTKSDGRRG